MLTDLASAWKALFPSFKYSVELTDSEISLYDRCFIVILHISIATLFVLFIYILWLSLYVCRGSSK